MRQRERERESGIENVLFCGKTFLLYLPSVLFSRIDIFSPIVDKTSSTNARNERERERERLAIAQ